MNIKQDYFFPQVHYFDLDFINIYEQSWARIESLWVDANPNESEIPSGYIDCSETPNINLLDVLMSTFFLLYSNSKFLPVQILDFFYNRQTEDGGIHPCYNKITGEKVSLKGNSNGFMPPLIVWAEYNYYNRTDNKKRLKEIIPRLDAYLNWLVNAARLESGFYSVPEIATEMGNIPRDNAKFFIDFHAQVALSFYYMIQLSTIANLKNLTFKYTKAYYNLKAHINKNFWCVEDNFYYDLDENFNFVKIKTINTFWTFLADIPNNSQSLHLKKALENPELFNTTNVFPTVASNSPYFSEQGDGFKGTVYPFLTYMVIKGLSKKGFHDLAREMSIKHISCILANFYSDENNPFGALWEGYQPNEFLPAKPHSKSTPIRKDFFANVGAATIALIIENVIGFDICLPKKMVYWTIPHLEFMGLESFQLKRNMISTILQRTPNGWEIRHGSEKLYYFSVDIQEKNIQKTLPIPSGKCTLIVDKL